MIRVRTIESTTRLIFGLRFRTSLVAYRDLTVPNVPGHVEQEGWTMSRLPGSQTAPLVLHFTLFMFGESKDMWRLVEYQSKVIRSLPEF